MCLSDLLNVIRNSPRFLHSSNLDACTSELDRQPSVIHWLGVITGSHRLQQRKGIISLSLFEQPRRDNHGRRDESRRGWGIVNHQTQLIEITCYESITEYARETPRPIRGTNCILKRWHLIESLGELLELTKSSLGQQGNCLLRLQGPTAAGIGMGGDQTWGHQRMTQ
ncbi:hypothetical protein GCM10010187_17680 [Actinomadura coerulea]|nr:hypothetical protein GCM10010187_17680 [Actinomadura coerulea]